MKEDKDILFDKDILQEDDNWIPNHFPKLEFTDDKVGEILEKYYEKDLDKVLSFIPTPPRVTSIRVNTNIIQTNDLKEKLEKHFSEYKDFSIKENVYLKDVLEIDTSHPKNNLVEFEYRVIVGLGSKKKNIKKKL
jgi:16S rRNA C967 or C1407 C5-methylase (RsmB/RsmF family)